MSEGYDNTNRGALFKNGRKKKETQPDYNGSLNVAGVDYWVSSWISTSKAGDKYMSLAVTPKEVQAGSKPQTLAEKAAPADKGEFDDDIPFAMGWIAPLGAMLLCLASTSGSVLA